MLERGIARRDFLKWSGAGLLAGVAGVTACTSSSAQSQPPTEEDRFSACVLSCRQPIEGNTPKSLFNCFLHCLPELQLQPRPISVDSLAMRLELIDALRVELKETPPETIIGAAFPITVRYPAWLAAGVSIELFELALAHSALPEFELKGWAYEHVTPHVASIDGALAPLCNLMRTPEVGFSSALETDVAAHLEALRGRLVLLADKRLIAMAEAIRQTSAGGETPVLLRLLVGIEEGESEAAIQSRLAADSPFEGDLTWTFSGPVASWSSTGRKDSRAIDKVASAVLTAGLLGQC